MIRLMKACAVFAILLLAACANPSGGAGEFRRISPAEENAVRARHVDAVNAYRAERGLQPVKVSSRLTAAAKTHARDMSVQKRAWHFGSDGSSPRDRAQRAGFAGEVVGENISESFDSEIELIQSWIAARPTNAVLLNPRATDIGFGWVQEADGKIWWVQLLGTSGPFQGS